MASTISPNMNLTVPTVGQELGPAWANDINADLSVIDGHNHSAGSGVPINPGGISINSDLPFGSNNATQLRAARFTAQASPIPNSGSDVGEIYVSGNELYYNDVTGGNQVQLTTNGSVNATSSGIASGTASAAFSAGVLLVKSNSTSGANVEMQSAVLTNSGNLTNTLTLQAPTLTTSLTETLPNPPASTTSIMQMDTSGNMSANLTVDGSTITIVSNQLVATLAASTQSQVNAGTNTGTFVNPSTLAGRTNIAIFNTAGTYTWTAPTGCNEVILIGRGGAGGGGGGADNGSNADYNAGGAGGGGVVSNVISYPVTPGTQYTIIVGAGGTGGARNAGASGSNGGNGIASSFDSMVFNNIGLGGAGGKQDQGSPITTSGGAASFCWGGVGGNGACANTTVSVTAATAGSNSAFSSSPGAAGSSATANWAGGGGGGAGDPGSTGGAGANSGGGSAGGNGSNGGGGGGGVGAIGHTGTAGGNGSDGQVVVIYENVSIINTNT